MEDAGADGSIRPYRPAEYEGIAAPRSDKHGAMSGNCEIVQRVLAVAEPEARRVD